MPLLAGTAPTGYALKGSTRELRPGAVIPPLKTMSEIVREAWASTHPDHVPNEPEAN